MTYRRFASPSSDGHDADTYQVLWDEPPQYGSPEKVRHAFIDQALSGGPGSERERKLLVARNMLDRGVISQADYDRMIAAASRIGGANTVILRYRTSVRPAYRLLIGGACAGSGPARPHLTRARKPWRARQ